MAESVDDGGSAFPVAADGYEALPGMSLRDWFAGMALQAVYVQAHVAKPAAENIAASAYEIADAMLAESKKNICTCDNPERS